MQLTEALGKSLLRDAGVPVPEGDAARSSEQAHDIARRLGGRTVIKAQIPAGKRGKQGGIRFADDPSAAADAARALLGTTLAGHAVEHVLVERAAHIAHELYAAILNDAVSGGPLVLFSTEGGMDIEEVHARSPERIVRRAVDIRHGFNADDARALLAATSLEGPVRERVAVLLAQLYATYRALDAELLEINPLAVDVRGDLYALDAKVAIDDSARVRNPERMLELARALGEQGTPLERRAREQGLLFIELDGEVGVLANGAGLTMTTLDVIAHLGGRAANFLEIGGDAYTKATPALELVLSNPRVRSILINFCGAFAQTDVMAEGVIAAIEALKPEIPMFFSIHGTGEERAIALVRERLGQEPFDDMDDAARAAIAAGRVA
ncbi:MAG: ADP-forming succinate--CoA ligase subunit beta [Vulcanimicrobiaceae bacterium]